MIPTYLHALTARVFPLRNRPAIADQLNRLPHPPATDVDLEAMLADEPLVQAALATLVEYSPSHWLVEAELTEIDARRQAFGFAGVASIGGPLTRAYGSDLIGLCCSGGGIRSATFSLGVLQGLAEQDLLRRSSRRPRADAGSSPRRSTGCAGTATT
jgi:predicted acylesterase/phospholipase RssA